MSPAIEACPLPHKDEFYVRNKPFRPEISRHLKCTKDETVEYHADEYMKMETSTICLSIDIRCRSLSDPHDRRLVRRITRIPFDSEGPMGIRYSSRLGVVEVLDCFGEIESINYTAAFEQLKASKPSMILRN